MARPGRHRLGGDRLPPAWRWRSRPRPGVTTCATSPRVHEQAVWLPRRRRRWCRHGVLAVLCLVRVRGVQRVEDDVLVVSIDRLMPVVRSARGAVLPPLGSGRGRPLSRERRTHRTLVPAGEAANSTTEFARRRPSAQSETMIGVGQMVVALRKQGAHPVRLRAEVRDGRLRAGRILPVREAVGETHDSSWSVESMTAQSAIRRLVTIRWRAGSSDCGA